MLNKDDKGYIKGEISNSVKNSEKRLKDYVHDVVKKSEKRLEGKIRNNGLIIEHLEDLILRIAENQNFTNKKLDSLIIRLDKTGVEKFPIIWNAVKNHEKKIAKLEAELV